MYPKLTLGGCAYLLQHPRLGFKSCRTYLVSSLLIQQEPVEVLTVPLPGLTSTLLHPTHDLCDHLVLGGNDPGGSMQALTGVDDVREEHVLGVVAQLFDLGHGPVRSHPLTSLESLRTFQAVQLVYLIAQLVAGLLRLPHNHPSLRVVLVHVGLEFIATLEGG